MILIFSYFNFERKRDHFLLDFEIPCFLYERPIKVWPFKQYKTWPVMERVLYVKLEMWFLSNSELQMHVVFLVSTAFYYISLSDAF